MFGFLRVKSCGLSEGDREAYRASFCSTCHSLRDFGGWWSSLATNYDITLWVALAQSLDLQEPPILSKPCTALPLRQVKAYSLEPRLGATASALNLALIGAKIRDNAEDGPSRWWGLADGAFAERREKAENYLRNSGFPVELIQELPKSQSLAEASSPQSLETLALPTRRVMSAVFAHLSELLQLPQTRSGLSRLGWSVGGYLYLWDALTDFEDDLRGGQFNAMMAVPEAQKSIKEHLWLEIQGMERELKSLPIQRNAGIYDRLLASLRQKLEARLPAPLELSRLQRLSSSRAAFLRTQDCDCCDVGCCGDGCCCEMDCCACDGDGCGPECCDMKCCNCGGGGGDSECCCAAGECCCDLDCCCCCYDDDTAGIRNSGGTSEAKLDYSIVCPGCGYGMREVKAGGTLIDACSRCGGVWLDDQELSALSKMRWLPRSLAKIKASQPHYRGVPEGQRSCPRCREVLQVVDFAGITVDACGSCQGLYLDNGELKQVLQRAR